MKEKLRMRRQRTNANSKPIVKDEGIDPCAYLMRMPLMTSILKCCNARLFSSP